MEQCIPKDALIAGIDKLKGKVSDGSSYCNGYQHALRMLELSLDTFEAKEVSLEEEIHKYQKEVYDRDTTVRDVARHFANWQKQQMMKDAVDGEIVSVNTRLGQMFIAKSEILNDDKFKWGDKVKLIIV